MSLLSMAIATHGPCIVGGADLYSQVCSIKLILENLICQHPLRLPAGFCCHHIQPPGSETRQCSTGECLLGYDHLRAVVC